MSKFYLFCLYCDLHWVRTVGYGTTGSCTSEESRVRDVLAPSRIAALTTGGLFTPRAPQPSTTFKIVEHRETVAS